MEGTQCFVPVAGEDSWLPGIMVAMSDDGKKATCRQLTIAADGEDEASTDAGTELVVDLGCAAMKEAGLTSMPLRNMGLPETGANDMCTLSFLHEPAILYNLRRRFLVSLPYTYTGTICIAINPYQWLDHLYADDLQKQYAKAADPALRSTLPPHAYAVSAVAMEGATGSSSMGERYRDQSILVSGESGAGKTETVKILMGHLASISTAEGGSGIIDRVLGSNPLLEGKFARSRRCRRRRRVPPPPPLATASDTPLSPPPAPPSLR